VERRTSANIRKDWNSAGVERRPWIFFNWRLLNIDMHGSRLTDGFLHPSATHARRAQAHTSRALSGWVRCEAQRLVEQEIPRLLQERTEAATLRPERK
jgi:hypothetical protein